ASSTALTGLREVGVILVVVACVAVWRVQDRSAAIVGLVALISEYAILGLSRQGVNTPAGVQYVYFGAAFLLPVFATAWLGLPRVARPAAIVLVAVALLANVMSLIYWSGEWPNYVARYDQFCFTCHE